LKAIDHSVHKFLSIIIVLDWQLDCKEEKIDRIRLIEFDARKWTS